jgi:hypothetical protein
VGGTAPGEGNTIAFNGWGGVRVVWGPAAVLSNSIFSNGDIGIDLPPDGRNANDPGDPDTGVNNLQNFPNLLSATIDGLGNLMVSYRVDTDPENATYPLWVELFEADSMASGEGRRLLFSDTWTTDDIEVGAKHLNLGSAADLGIHFFDPIVATATDDAGNTSEFSMCLEVGPVTPVFSDDFESGDTSAWSIAVP